MASPVVSRWRERLFSTATAERSAWRRAAWRLRSGARHGIVGRPLAKYRQAPGVVVVGAQRSGTTSLFRLLQGHPDVVWPANIKSPHWYDVNYDRSLDWYLGHFPLRSRLSRPDTPPQITGEAAPYYLFHPYVASRLASHLPDARIVVILRNPVDRAWSHYQHEVARGHEQLSFEEALDAEPQRLAGSQAVLARKDGVHLGHRRHAYVQRGMYAEQLARYFDEFPSGQVLVLFTAELSSEPQVVFDRLCDFLAITRHQLPTTSRHHARDYTELDVRVQDRLNDVFQAPNRELLRLLGRPLPWV